MGVPDRPKPSHIHKGSRSFSSLHHLPTLCLSIFSREIFLSSTIPEASPFALIYLLPLRDRPSSLVTFAGINTSDHHRNTFVSQHLSIFFLFVVVITSRNTFVWPHLRFTSPPPPMVASRVTFASVNTSDHGCVWRQHLRHGVSVLTFIAFGFPLFLLFPLYCFTWIWIWITFFFKFDDFWDLLWLFNEFMFPIILLNNYFPSC